jgi:hypothetical protein
MGTWTIEMAWWAGAGTRASEEDLSQARAMLNEIAASLDAIPRESFVWESLRSAPLDRAHGERHALRRGAIRRGPLGRLSIQAHRREEVMAEIEAIPGGRS